VSYSGESAKGVNRRGFLKTAAVGAAALGLGAAATPRAGARPRGANDRINIGMIGVGGRGSWLAGDILAKAKDGQNIAITAVCDVYDVRAQDVVNRTKNEIGVDAKRCRDYRELIELPDLDAVIIATPDHWHAKQSIEAMRKGLDVYCEKPMTLYWHEAKEVSLVAGETDAVFQCGAGSGSDGNWWTVGDIVRDGGVGPLIWTQGGAFRNDPSGDWNWGILPCDPKKDLDWPMWLGSRFGLAPERAYDPERYSRFRKYWDYSGGLATDLLYHVYAHLILGMVPQFPYRVTASGGNPVHTLENDNREVPTLFHVLADYPLQHTLHMVGTQESEDGVPDLVRGQMASVSAGGPGAVVRVQGPFADAMMEKAKTLACYEDAELVTGERDGKTVLSEIRVPRRYDWGDHVQNWIDCMRSRKLPTLNARLAYLVEVPIALSVMSFREGRAIYFDPDTEQVVDELPKPRKLREDIPAYLTGRKPAAKT